MMTKRLTLLFLSALLVFYALPVRAEGMPAWEYPLSPEILDDFDEYIILANRKHLLSSDYKPGDLVNTTCKKSSDAGTPELRQAASDAINAMFAAAQQDGLTLYLKSAYRSYVTQKTMYNNRLDKLGRDDGLVSYPGASDHQTGLGADILNYEWTKKDGMNKEFAKTKEAQWMEAHCAEFGFILRYMSDKEEITGIKFEPWHFRYVGKEAAAYIMENHLSLEEFTEEWQAYVADWEARGGDFRELIIQRAQVNRVTVLDDEGGEEELSIFY
ncbi:MAG: M15 family metallopeptidase [Clostridia bacterium]|nr:M15 family metallopeptidase [Clostridia bacterium]